jgi:ParB family chromosome partitioning protein
MSKRNRLGRGLGALFEESGETEELKRAPEKEAEKTAAEETAVSLEDRTAESGTGSVAKVPPAKTGTVREKKKRNTEKPAERRNSGAALTERADDDGRIYVSTALIDASGDQPRKAFDAGELAELAESIRNYGVLQPLLVVKKDERYEIIAGERRFRAAKMAGLTKVPVIIGDYSRQQSMEVQLIENIQRSDLNPIEEAEAYQRLIREFGLRQEDLAQRLSKNRATITNSMRLLKLDERVQKMLVSGELSTGHARALLGISDPEEQYATAKKIAENGLSVREVEKLVKKLAEAEEKPAEPEESEEDREKREKVDLFYRDLEDRLKEVMGTKVQIHRKDDNRGKIEIEYYSPEELDRITEMLKSIRES